MASDLTNKSVESPLTDILGLHHEDTLVQVHEVAPGYRLDPPGFEERRRCDNIVSIELLFMIP